MSRLLLIDAFRDEADIYAEYLRACGFLTVVCRNPQDGIAKALRATPDLVVTHLRQPGSMTGTDVARLLKAHDATRDVPILMITTSMDAADRGRGAKGRVYLLFPAAYAA